MLPTSIISITVLMCTSFAASAHAWSPIRTDEAGWQDNCGHSSRAGSVCIDSRFGEKTKFRVQDKAYNYAAFSSAGNNLVAYCPNLSKGEQPYSLQYLSHEFTMNLQIQGRPSNQRCCNIQYTVSGGGLVVNKCIEPTAGTNYRFPAPDLNTH